MSYNNKTTLFTYFLNGTLVSKKVLFCTRGKPIVQKSAFLLTLAPFKKCVKKICRYIFKKKSFHFRKCKSQQHFNKIYKEIERTSAKLETYLKDRHLEILIFYVSNAGGLQEPKQGAGDHVDEVFLHDGRLEQAGEVQVDEAVEDDHGGSLELCVPGPLGTLFGDGGGTALLGPPSLRRGHEQIGVGRLLRLEQVDQLTEEVGQHLHTGRPLTLDL